VNAVSTPHASVPVVAQRREARKVLAAVLLLLIVSALTGIGTTLDSFSVPDVEQSWTTVSGLVASIVFSIVGTVATRPVHIGRVQLDSTVVWAAFAGLFGIAFQVHTALRMSAVASILVLAVYIRTMHRASIARVQCSVLALAVAGSLALGEAASSPSEVIVALFCVVAFTEVLGSAGASLRSAALCDPLTGVFNRTGAEHGFARLTAQLRRRTDRVAIIAFDIDNFKDLNDNYGHAAGDRALAELALSWSSRAPSRSILGRVGGDEFVLITPVSNHAEARQLAETMVAGQSVSASYGLAVSTPKDKPFETLLADADADLYRYKRRPNGEVGSPRNSAGPHRLPCSGPSVHCGPQL
jgi:diguanylate cyclase (GGDEF)-like protein